MLGHPERHITVSLASELYRIRHYMFLYTHTTGMKDADVKVMMMD